MQAGREDPEATDALLEGSTHSKPSPTPRAPKLRMLGAALCLACVILSLAGCLSTCRQHPAPSRRAQPEELDALLVKAARRALGGGFSGAIAGVIQAKASRDKTPFWLHMTKPHFGFT
tara:strand:+ start:130 stop:483 length:354 start_codon:yes stop_codon:yes gene_type:complete